MVRNDGLTFEERTVFTTSPNNKNLMSFLVSNKNLNLLKTKICLNLFKRIYFTQTNYEKHTEIVVLIPTNVNLDIKPFLHS